MANRSTAAKVVDDRPHEHVWAWLLGGGALVAVCVGILAGRPIVLGSGAILAGLLVLSRLIIDVRGGTTSSNWGTWRRHESPIRYHTNIGFWGLVTIFWFAIGILAIIGTIEVAAP